LDGKNFNLAQMSTWAHQNVRMDELLYKFAQDQGLPFDQMVDSELFVTDKLVFGPDEKETHVNPITLNQKGHGQIA
jgi:hypothetical protein